MTNLNNRLAIIGAEVAVGSVLGLSDFNDYLYHGHLPSARVLPNEVAHEKLSSWLIEGAISQVPQVDYPSTALLVVSDDVIDVHSRFEHFKFAHIAQCQNVSQAISQVSHVLSKKGVKSVLLLAMNEATHEGHDLKNRLEPKAIKFAFDKLQNANYPMTQGGVALLFKNQLASLHSGIPIWANVAGEAASCDAVEASTLAHKLAARPLDHVGYLEVSHAGKQDAKHGKLTQLLMQVRNESKTQLSCGLGAASCIFGHLGKAAPALSILKAAILLRQRYVSALNEFSGFDVSSCWDQTPFYIPQQSRYWFIDKAQTRVAAVHALEDAGQHFHVLLSQGNAAAVAQPLIDDEHLFLPVAANSEQEFLQKLSLIRQNIKSRLQLDQPTLPSKKLFSMYLDQFSVDQKTSNYALVIQGQGLSIFLDELKSMMSAVSSTLKTQGEWHTPAGSYFSAKPIGASGVAFSYPGVGMTYTGMAQDLQRYFPEAFESLDQKGLLGQYLQHSSLYPRELNPLTKEERKQKETLQRKNLAALATSGVGCAKVFSNILRRTFKIEPKFALGYSMGEVSMWAGLDVWNEPEKLMSRINKSDVFQQQITGELTAVKDAWGVSATPAWDSFTFKADYKQVKDKLKDFPKCYLSIVNGETCVVAGDPASCKALAKEMSCTAMASGFVTAIHTEPAKGIYKPLMQMFDLSISQPQPLHFYSASNVLLEDKTGLQNKPVLQTKNNIAHSISQAFTSPLYFSRLIKDVHKQGAKLFIEVGAGRSCTSLTNKILKGSQHCAVPFNNKGQQDRKTILNMLAQVISHKVPVDLSALLRESGHGYFDVINNSVLADRVASK